MNILLLHIPQITNTKREIMVIPMGLFSIADFLNKNNYTADILHYGVEKELDANFDIIKHIRERNYKIVCLDLHWLKQSRQVINIIHKIKGANLNLHIVLGGITATFYAEEILRGFEEVDFIIRGEGEVPLLKLIETLNKNGSDFQKIPNLSYRKGTEVIHNHISFYTDAKFYENISHSNFKYLNNYKHYLKTFLYADFDISTKNGMRDSYRNTFYYNPGKGCPFNCIYCGSYFYKKEYIGCKNYYFFSHNKSYKDIINALNYGVDTLRVSFDPDPKREFYLRLFSKLKGKNLRLIFDCFTLPNVRFVKSVKESFRDDSVLVLSIETGSDEVRKKIKRPFFNNEELLRCIKSLLKFRLNVHTFISYGFPYETKDDLKSTISLIKEIKKYETVAITVCPIILDIGSQLYFDYSKYQINIQNYTFNDWLQSEISDMRTYYSTKYLKEEEIIRSLLQIKAII